MSEAPARVVALTGAVLGRDGQEVPLVKIPCRIVVNNLPSANTIRWTIRRKVEIVTAVRNGILTLDEACERYRLSAEEFLHWERLIAAHGLSGLKATRLKLYRRSGRKDNPAQKLSWAQSGPDAPKSGHQSLNVDPFAGGKRDR